jgi:hypothetical protein
MPGIRPDVDWRVLCNQMKLLGSCRMLGLHEDCLDENIRILIEGIAGYLFDQ